MKRIPSVIGGVILLTLTAGLVGSPTHAATGDVIADEVDGSGQVLGSQDHLEIASADCFTPPTLTGETDLIIRNNTDQTISVTENGTCPGALADSSTTAASTTQIEPRGTHPFHLHGHSFWLVDVPGGL